MLESGSKEIGGLDKEAKLQVLTICSGVGHSAEIREILAEWRSYPQV